MSSWEPSVPHREGYYLSSCHDEGLTHSLTHSLSTSTLVEWFRAMSHTALEPAATTTTLLRSWTPLLLLLLHYLLVRYYYSPNQLPRKIREFHMEWISMVVHRFLDLVYTIAQTHPSTHSGKKASSLW